MKFSHTNPPSLRALTALKLLAETGSISKTADHLQVTHGAVSHMLRTLEGQLNIPLTKRVGRGVILTGQGQQYVGKISQPLDQITQAASSLNSATGPLRLNATSGFAANWLTHHLTEFRRLFPDISLELITPRSYGDLGQQEDDLYVTFARAKEMPDTAQLLLEVEFFPVCAPVIRTALKSHSDLENFDLLHLDTRNDWARWLDAAEATPKEDYSSILFDNMQSMLAAAIAAQGICLGDQLTCRQALSDGVLQRPFPESLHSPRAYYILDGRKGPTPATEAVTAWLLDKFRS